MRLPWLRTKPVLPPQDPVRTDRGTMLSAHMGALVTVDGRTLLRVDAGYPGHAAYGPYDHVRPGRFRVDYELALPQAHAGEAEAAVLDIAAYHGTAELARLDVRADELGPEPRTFSIHFDNREFRSLEYRVFATGAAALLVGEPRLTRLGDVPGPAPEPDPTADTTDPVELGRMVRGVLRLLRPQRAVGVAKVRLGHAGDGGYVCLDDFAGLDAALSFGINDDISWDLDAADRGLVIHQFDHTVEDPAPDDPRMRFHKKMIAPHSSDTTASLADLVRQHDRGAARPNLFLKFDIEGGEWPMLDATDAELLGRCAQIVCEIHYLDLLRETASRTTFFRCLSKLAAHHAVVHVHSNICGGVCNIANVVFPTTLELTFANRALYRFEDTDETFPGPLDISCHAYEPDFWLGSFRY